MNPFCSLLLPGLSVVLQIPYNLFSGLGLTDLANLISFLFNTIGRSAWLRLISAATGSAALSNVGASNEARSRVAIAF